MPGGPEHRIPQLPVGPAGPTGPAPAGTGAVVVNSGTPSTEANLAIGKGGTGAGTAAAALAALGGLPLAGGSLTGPLSACLSIPATTAGTSQAYTVTIPGFTADHFVEGTEIFVKFHTLNGSGPTINVNGLGGKSIVSKWVTSGNVFVGAGILYGAVRLVYNGSHFAAVACGLGKDDVPASLNATSFLNYIYAPTLFALYRVANTGYNNSYISYCGGQGDSGEGAFLRPHGYTNANYPGAMQEFASQHTRAASTGVGICPVASGYTCWAELQTNETGTSMRVQVEVDSAGTVTITGAAMYVNSSTPGASEVGIYLESSVLKYKPGSGKSTFKAAAFSRGGTS